MSPSDSVISPRVRNSMTTRSPRAACAAIVPAQPTSSSGWASATSRVFTAHPPHRYRAGPPVPARRLPVPLIDFSIRQRHYPRFMELKLAVFCDQAHEGSDGRLDLVGIFDELAAPGFPAMQNRM